MLFSSVPTLVSLLSVATLATSSSVSKLERRSTKVHAPYTNVYIMRQHIDYTNGSLPIYTPDGNIAFQFVKNVHDKRQGVSSTMLMTNSLQPILKFRSTNDVCGINSDYLEPNFPGSAQHKVELYTNGALQDHWRFSFLAPPGVRLNFRFDRNYWNKEGKVYAEVKGHDDVLLAKFKNEERKDSWLLQGHKKVKTYTLYSTAGAPQVELVSLLALVLTRVYDCGL
ncbi:hypothetical protein MJO29_008405 [Puccinia striiformis f. sp. tritici]|uniref:Glycoside hydrolase 131 catalytic N-terminal domain-containing protein n=1 Tax=Puccinia striiformis f. sp. tritici PST-78 TaxID=1165861 RepID=A0A0L0VFZ1_9BASI|nr:hypothetical protein Pst134EA_015421 [Puccinia striiformis f. sp. tritici]KAI9604608.1 hypothetical protein KEM48_002361 [Puccinia striiformis f. sp. tritici PST-130]KNE98215.1 hypothetical protein PSTG_08484 [Puccinia striiformis f. sp. tritici PST-78]KAH9452579.1 hypothetical protein Pst134EB_016531 [Puccinia striiformis f. sp. tritici]KAH9463336.1 hypothetical protein Pst134EA_015421 [Puccinia striiformis f. sp. tritici]KAI7952774.1 hypothetical protein MJO29_008405 [Puccinia striiformis